jgi:hypothetical protein
MNIRIKLIAALLLCSFLKPSYGQSYDLENFSYYSSLRRGLITKDNVIKGYYNFYQVEKVDKKTGLSKLIS